MHKTRFIWLKNPWNLTEHQAHRLGELQRLNLKINRAYLLKELFRHFWEYRRGGWAKRYLKKWFWWVTHSRLEPMRDVAWMLRRHEEGILNYFRVPIDNGTVEGLNNQTKLVIHKAYGFRTAKNYIRSLSTTVWAPCLYPKPYIHSCEEPDFSRGEVHLLGEGMSRLYSPSKEKGGPKPSFFLHQLADALTRQRLPLHYSQ